MPLTTSSELPNSGYVTKLIGLFILQLPLAYDGESLGEGASSDEISLVTWGEWGWGWGNYYYTEHYNDYDDNIS